MVALSFQTGSNDTLEGVVGEHKAKSYDDDIVVASWVLPGSLYLIGWRSREDNIDAVGWHNQHGLMSQIPAPSIKIAVTPLELLLDFRMP